MAQAQSKPNVVQVPTEVWEEIRQLTRRINASRSKKDPDISMQEVAANCIRKGAPLVDSEFVGQIQFVGKTETVEQSEYKTTSDIDSPK